MHEFEEIYPAFLAEVLRLGGTRDGAEYWLRQAIAIGLEHDDSAANAATKGRANKWLAT